MTEYNYFDDDSLNHNRTIIHIDLDCFYAQVEMIKNPLLRTKPLGIQQKNLLVTCNYPARELGLKKCMPLKEAIQICPSLVVVNGEDLYDYRKMSYRVTAYLQQYSAMTERLGLDENFIDVSNVVNDRLRFSEDVELIGHVFNNINELCHCGCEHRLKIGSVIAQEIRDGLKRELGLTSCAGIAHNKLLAKLAGALHKPNQQTIVFPKDAIDLVALHDFSKIPGIGVATMEILNGINIRNIRDLQNCDYKTLVTAFTPEKAKYLIDLSFGKDFLQIKTSGKPQSIGLEDSCKSVTIETEIEEKFIHLLKRLLLLVCEDGRIPTTIKVTVRKLDNVNRSGHRETRQCNISPNLFSFDHTTNSVLLKEKYEKKLLSIIMNLFHKLISNTKSFHITLLGLSFTKFYERSLGKKSIASYFVKDLAVQSITNIENKSVFIQNEPTTSKNITNSPECSETEAEPLSKKFRCSSLWLDTNNGCLSDCEYSSPSKLRVADLRLNSRDGEDVDIHCPPNANEDVFCELPADLQKELWESWKRESDRDDNSMPSKKVKTNTILNYFVKNC